MDLGVTRTNIRICRTLGYVVLELIQTLVHVVAAQKGSPEFLRSLIAAGADPNSVTTARLKPIEHVVKASNHEGVTILFPETQSISNYPDWSIHGITSYFHSKEFLHPGVMQSFFQQHPSSFAPPPPPSNSES
ncbi:hypothetical protein DH2020_039513 [Rehmannia glutinosa]|uniref:Uncharacterized protein n=1 Tax=Rehmannia glutinosa TaxID=99300 RepID=A0ABR0UWS7_REHGL